MADSNNINDYLIKELEKRKQLNQHNKGVYYAYNKAIKAIKQFNQPITSGEMAKQLNGIGKVMESKIDEILKNSNQTQLRSSGGNNNEDSNSQNSSICTSNIKIPSNIKMPTVPEWLEKIGFSCYLDGFLEAGYDNIRVCEELTDEDLQHISSNIKPGHRKSILIASKELKELRQAQRNNLSIFQVPLIDEKRNNSNTNPVIEEKEKNPLPNCIPKVIRTRNGGILPKVTESFIKINSSDQIMNRALDIFNKGLIKSLILDGEVMRCKVQSSINNTLYNILFDLNIETEKITRAICECNYDKGDWCKHIVAVLLALNQHQEGKISKLINSSDQTDLPSTSSISQVNSSNNKKSKSLKNPKSSKISSSSSHPKEYRPLPRSGPWAILVTLYEASLDPNFPGFLFKKEIISKGKEYCDTPFEEADNGYSAWSSIKTLVQKELVSKQRNPPQYSLTETGENLAIKLFQEKQTLNQQKLVVPYSISPIKPSNSSSFAIKSISLNPKNMESNLNNLASSQKEKATENSSIASVMLDLNSPFYDTEEEFLSVNKPQVDLNSNSNTNSQTKSQSKTNSHSISMNKNTSQTTSTIDERVLNSTLEIILLLDNRETNQERHKDLYQDLIKSKIKVEKRNLQLGDIMWIARSVEFDEEIVLDFVIERKRISDLLMSIEDGRYLEQKFRLKKCGLSRIVYLVEGSIDEHLQETVESSLVNTQIDDNFFIQRTRTEEETIQYLINLTHHFEQNNLNYRQNAILSPFTYEAFSNSTSKSKNLTLKDLFVKQLLQIPSCTVQKVAAIVQQYPTPRSLLTAYDNLILETDRIHLLKNLEYGEKKRKLGPKLSETIYYYYSSSSSSNNNNE